MDFNKLNLQSTQDKKTFIKNFGYYLMTVSRKELPLLIEIAMQTQDELIHKKILNNIPFLLKKVKIGELGTLLKVLFKNIEYYNIVIENFTTLCDYFASNNIESVIEAFLDVNNYSKIITENFETFLENSTSPAQTNKIVDLVKHIPKCAGKISQYNSIVRQLGNFSFLEHLNPGTMLKLVYNDKLDYIKQLFIKYSNGNLENVRYLSNGFTSSVFSVDDKVIKIGKKRVVFNIPFSKYLLQPYLRKELFGSKGDVISTVEIQDFCSTKDITQAEADEFVKSLNDSGISWLDSGKQNIFRLLRDNRRKILPLEDGFSYSEVQDDSHFLKAGSLIIGDNDFVYTKEDALVREDSFRTPPHKTTFSLILPTYNMEKYLGNCLNSILNQTCNDFEVIIVIDGSKDNSEEIANSYAAIDNRFKVFHFENGGLSTARNRGLELAKGNYILFVDPDDSIEPELLEKLQPYTNSGIETIRFGAIVQGDSPKKDKFRFNRPYYPNITSGVEALKLWNDDKRYSTAWLYCIKKDVYDRCSFRFPQVKIYEDVASIPKLIANSKTVAMLDYIGYDYIQHDGSITNTPKSDKALYDLRGFMTAYDIINESMSKYFGNCKEQIPIETINEILDGLFIRLENKFRHTNELDKDMYAQKLFKRNRLFPINYNPQQYYSQAVSETFSRVFYNGLTNVTSITSKDTTITKLGDFTYNINNQINKVGLFRIEKSGNYNFTDSFVCMSNIDFEKALIDEKYKEILFKYLLSYTNIFLAQCMNGSYIGDIKQDNNMFSIHFDPECTQFARYWRGSNLRINDGSNYPER